MTSSYDTPGTLFVGILGNRTDVRATYFDHDDGTGQPCRAGFRDATFKGEVRHSTSVDLSTASVLVTRTRLSDNGDNDGWADDHETVQMQVQVLNKSGMDLTDLRLLATSSDPYVGCITKTVLEFGDLPAGESRWSDDAFEFVMGAIGRTDVDESLTALLNIAVAAVGGNKQRRRRDLGAFQEPGIPG